MIMKNFIFFLFLSMALFILTACEKDKVTEKDLASDVIPLIPKVNPCEKVIITMNVDSLLRINTFPTFINYVSYEVCECDTIDVITTHLPLDHVVVWNNFDTLIPPIGILKQYNSLFEIRDTILQSTFYFGELILDFDECP